MTTPDAFAAFTEYEWPENHDEATPDRIAKAYAFRSLTSEWLMCEWIHRMNEAPQDSTERKQASNEAVQAAMMINDASAAATLLDRLAKTDPAAAQETAYDLWATAWSGESATIAADLLHATGIDIDDLWQRGRKAATEHATTFLAAQRTTPKET